MVGNILKVFAAVILGYLVGMLIGGVVGILIGLIPSFSIGNVISVELSFLISAFLATIYGSLLGVLEIRIFNRFFDTNYKQIVGALVGIPFGLIFGIFTYFALDLSVPDAVTAWNILVYNGAMSSRIGAAIFSLYAATQTIRELFRYHTGVSKFR